MQLEHITIEQLRLHRYLSLPLASGLTVLEGPNECGKSTVAEAIHRALFLPSRSSGASLAQLRCRPFEADPIVRLQFGANAEHFTLTKRFAGSRGSVSLKDGSGSVLEGELAEEKLAELVGASAVRGGNPSRLRERWAHLWVWQGAAADDPFAFGSEALDQDRLLQQLQHQARTIQSSFDQQLQTAVRQRWLQSHTEGGREGRAGSDLDRAIKAEASARQRLEQLEAEQEAQHRAEAAFAQASASLQALDQQLPLLRQFQDAVAQQQLIGSNLAQLTPLMERGQNAAAARHQLQERLAPTQQQLDGLQAALPDLERTFQTSNAQLDRALAQAEALQQWIRRLQLEQQLQQVEAIALRQEQVNNALSQLPAVDSKALDTLQALERQRQNAAVALASLSTGLELTSTEESLWLNDQPLHSGSAVDLAEDAVLRNASGSFLLQIRPGGSGRLQQLRRDLKQAQDQLALELHSLKLPDLNRAIAAERERRDLLAEQRHLSVQRGDIQLDVLRQQIKALPRPDCDGSEGLSSLRTQLDALVPQGKELRLLRNQAEEALQKHRRQLEQLQQTCQADQQALTRAEAVLDELDQGHGGLKQLAANLEDLRQQHQRCKQQQLMLQRQLHEAGRGESDNPDLAALEQQREHFLQQRAASSALLEAQGDGDRQACLEHARADLEHCSEERLRLQDEARMLNLLLSTFEHEQSQLSESYSEPLATALESYLRCFTDEPSRVALRFDPRAGFADLHWQRDSGVAWAFGDLSGGTRELLSAALRLAIAELLAPAYDNCLPVLFDDAFTNVDPSRWPALAAMLAQASHRGLQVLVLSCDPGFCASLAPDAHHHLPLKPRVATELRPRRNAA